MVISPVPAANFSAIIPAGGSGTRLWPLSRQGQPKFLLDLFGTGKSMLEQTVDRLLPLCGPDRVFAVTGSAHAAQVAQQCPDLAGNILVEPSPRDSMAAIGLAAAVIHERHGDTVIGSFAADHVITDTAGFQDAVRQAIAVAQEGYLVTIGIPATRPSVAFGYIGTGEPLDIGAAPGAQRVTGFEEKPDSQTAMRYLATGRYRWNAGMFVVSTSVLLGHLQTLRPAMFSHLKAIASAWESDTRDEVMGELWPLIDKVPIDIALAEPVAAEGGVAVISASFGWDDVGDFNSLAALLPARGELGNKVIGDDSLVVTQNVAGSIIGATGGRTVAVLGIDDVVVVDTPDALLVTTRARAQQVRNIVTAVAAQVDPPPV